MLSQYWWLWADVIYAADDCLEQRYNMASLGHYELTHSPLDKNGCHFANDIFKCIFVNEKFCILIKISLKFVPKGPIVNNPPLG